MTVINRSDVDLILFERAGGSGSNEGGGFFDRNHNGIGSTGHHCISLNSLRLPDIIPHGRRARDRPHDSVHATRSTVRERWGTTMARLRNTQGRGLLGSVCKTSRRAWLSSSAKPQPAVSVEIEPEMRWR